MMPTIHRTKIYCLSYEKGTFNAMVEKQGKGESEVTFACRLAGGGKKT